MSLCLAACDVSGQWICENEGGEYFIQGKTEVELYHGQASFFKIYPRDVSRQFENEKRRYHYLPENFTDPVFYFGTHGGTQGEC